MVSHQVLHHEDPIQGEMYSKMASHQVLQYKGPYKGAMFPTMASHQVLYHEDPKKAEMFSTMAPHQVLYYEDHCKGEMGSQGVQQPGNICKALQQPVNVVNKNVSATTEVKVNVKSVSVPTEVENMSVSTEAKNVSVPTEVEFDVNTDPEGEKQMSSLAPSSKGVIIVNMVSKQHRDYNLVSKNLSVHTRAKYIKTHKIKGHKILKTGNFKEKIDSARVGQAKRGKIKNKKIGAPHPSPGNTKRTKFRVIYPYPRPPNKDTNAEASKEGAVGKDEVEVPYVSPVLEEKQTNATFENVQPWPNESRQLGGFGVY